MEFEKKIEEAKKAFIANKKVLGVIAMNDLDCGFNACAHWAIGQFLKDLWYDASEEPKYNRQFYTSSTLRRLMYIITIREISILS